MWSKERREKIQRERSPLKARLANREEEKKKTRRWHAKGAKKDLSVDERTEKKKKKEKMYLHKYTSLQAV